MRTPLKGGLVMLDSRSSTFQELLDVQRLISGSGWLHDNTQPVNRAAVTSQLTSIVSLTEAAGQAVSSQPAQT